MGSLLLAARRQDLRFALPNARIMVHQPSGGFQGQVPTSCFTLRKSWNMTAGVEEIYVRHTGQPLKKIEDPWNGTCSSPLKWRRISCLIDKVNRKSRPGPNRA